MSSTMKMIEGLEQLPYPYNKLAILRTDDDVLNGPCVSLTPLKGAFAWGETSEGYDFWSEVSKGGHPPIPSSSRSDVWWSEYNRHKNRLTKQEWSVAIISTISVICIMALAIYGFICLMH